MAKMISKRRLTLQFLAFWITWLVVQIFLNTPIEHHLAGWWQELALDAIKLLVWLGGGWVFLPRAARHPNRVSESPMAPRLALHAGLLGLGRSRHLLSRPVLGHPSRVTPESWLFTPILGPLLLSRGDHGRVRLSGLLLKRPVATHYADES